MTVITVIGAGSASFGENTLAALMHSKKLRGSTLRLVDRNPQSLDIVHRLANRLNRDWNASFDISAHTDHREALEGANFVVSAIEVGPREGLWKSDYEIPLKYGVHQPYAENGGPGGFAHAARNIGPVLEIAHEMEQACPQAWYINFTNPMVRICDAINRHSKIKVVGLCHQIYAGYVVVGVALSKDLGIEIPEGLVGLHADVMQHPLQQSVKAQAVSRLDIVAAGTNHFTWILSLRDHASGEDLYPLLRTRFFEMNADFEPLTRQVFRDFGLLPVPGDTHLCEYLPWMADPVRRPWETFNIRLYDWDLMAGLRDFSLDRLNDMANETMTIDALLESDSEGALEIIENIAFEGDHYHLAANLPNRGQITNLPANSIVETPVHVSGRGVDAVKVGPLPPAIAELCRRELALVELCVDAAVEGSYEKALQCMLLDACVQDARAARMILDEYLATYKEHLPQFWK